MRYIKLLFAFVAVFMIGYTACSAKESTSSVSELSTAQLRALASINMGNPEKIVKKVIFMLTGQKWKDYTFFHNEQIILTPLEMFKEEKVHDVLDYYGVELTKKQFHDAMDHATIVDLITFIMSEKADGLFADEAWACLEVVLHDFIADKKNELTNKNFNIIKQIYKKTKYRRRRCDITEKLSNLHYASYRNAIALSFYEKALREYLDEEMEKIESCRGKEVGHFTEGGWSGHFLNVEIYPNEDGSYSVFVANAGGGADRYHMAEVFSAGELRRIYYTVNEYRIGSQGEIYDILENIMKCCNYDIDSNSDDFYSMFVGKTQIINLGVPSRPVQHVGNCGVRNQEELIFRILQRCDAVDLANKFQDYIIEFYQKQVGDLYPALRDQIEAQKPLIKKCLLKPPIEPIVSGGIIEIEACMPLDMKVCY